MNPFPQFTEIHTIFLERDEHLGGWDLRIDGLVDRDGFPSGLTYQRHVTNLQHAEKILGLLRHYFPYPQL